LLYFSLFFVLNSGHGSAPWPLKLASGLLMVSNGQYYGQRVVASWAVHAMNLKSEKKKQEIDHKNNPLDSVRKAEGWGAMGFSPSTRKTVAESFEKNK
jgi:hypothetical protein